MKKMTNLPLPILSDDLTTTEADSEDSNYPPPPPHSHLPHVQRHHAHYSHHHSHFHTEIPNNNVSCSLTASGGHAGKIKLPTIYSGPPTTSENNTETDSDDEVEDDEDILASSSSDCGECCGGHAPYPALVTRVPNIIPATMCKSTQISPTTVIEMYAAAASIRRRNTNNANTAVASNCGSLQRSKPCPNGFHVPCPVVPPKPMVIMEKMVNGKVKMVNQTCPQHGLKATKPNGIQLKANPPAPPIRKSGVKVNGESVNEIGMCKSVVL